MMQSIEIKADNKVVREAVMDDAVKELDRLLRNGVLLDEIFLVLQNECFIPKKLIVVQHSNDYWMVYHRDLETGLGKGKLFSNPSMTAAIEFALKYQPDNDG